MGCKNKDKAIFCTCSVVNYRHEETQTTTRGDGRREVSHAFVFVSWFVEGLRVCWSLLLHWILYFLSGVWLRAREYAATIVRLAPQQLPTRGRAVGIDRTANLDGRFLSNNLLLRLIHAVCSIVLRLIINRDSYRMTWHDTIECCINNIWNMRK